MKRKLVACVFVTMLACPLGAGTLTEKEAAELHEQLKPAADEPWRTIPWQVSLLEAQRLAAKEKKPIFIWAMDGHPLGCT
jgi:hypothetical protein